METFRQEVKSGRPAGVRARAAGVGRRSAAGVLGAVGLAMLAGVAASACGTGSTSFVAHGGGTGSTGPAGTGATSSTPVPTTPTTLPPILGAGVQGPASAIPWGEVGSGWTLVQSNPGTTANTATSIFVVDPLGGRYLVTSAAPAGASLAAWAGGAKVGIMVTVPDASPSTGPVTVTGVDLTSGQTLYTTVLTGGVSSWGPFDSLSGDGTRALFSTSVGTASTQVTELDVTSGAVLHQFQFTGGSVEYTRPAGLALVAIENRSIRRIGLDGSTQLAFPSTFSEVGAAVTQPVFGAGFALYTPDGGSLVVGAATGLAYLSNDGSVVKQLPVPVVANGPGSGCSPLEWWAAGVVLATCPGPSEGGSGSPSFVGQSYYEVPLDGSSPTRLGSADGFVGQVYKVGNDAFGQVEACASQSIARVGPTGPVVDPVPGLKANSQHIVTAVGDQLEVLGQSGCDPASQPTYSLVWFNPATNATTYLIGPPVSGGSVEEAIPYQP